ncbi:MAG: F0F1 ATP synthase subunit B [bacterium]
MLAQINLLLVLLSEGSEVGGPLDVNPGLAIWTLITFILLWIVLKKFAWKPILNSLNEREKFIKESLEKADTAQKDAQRLMDENKVNSARAEEEARKIIDQGRHYAEELKEKILSESKSEAKKMIEAASIEIDRKNKEAFSKLKEQVADIAVKAAEKIIRENLDKEKQLKIVTNYINDLPKN